MVYFHFVEKKLLARSIQNVLVPDNLLSLEFLKY